MFYVYAIHSKTRNYIYVGLTDNLQRRLAQHNNGDSRTTRAYRPFELFYQEPCSTRKVAREREKKLKTGAGKEFLKSLLAGTQT